MRRERDKRVARVRPLTLNFAPDPLRRVNSSVSNTHPPVAICSIDRGARASWCFTRQASASTNSSRRLTCATPRPPRAIPRQRTIDNVCHLAATIPQRAFPRQDVQHRGGDARAHAVATQPRQRRHDDGRGVAHTHAVTRGAPRGASGAAHVARFLARELPSAHGATLARGIARGSLMVTPTVSPTTFERRKSWRAALSLDESAFAAPDTAPAPVRARRGLGVGFRPGAGAFSAASTPGWMLTPGPGAGPPRLRWRRRRRRTRWTWACD